MASLDSLPADQRAVIQLVLQQGRRYDDIAAMLSIDRAGVRQRALDAFDALGPDNSIPDPQRALLTDYLLGQLPTRVADQVQDGIAEDPAQRAWLRIVASEVGGLATAGLPAIPAPGARRAGAAAGAFEDAPEPESPQGPAARSSRRSRRSEPAVPTRAAAGPSDPASETSRTARSGGGRSSSAGSGGLGGSSRRGGAILLGAGAAVIIAAIVVILVFVVGGSSKPHHVAATGATTPAAASTTGTSTTGTSTTATKAKFLNQVNLNSPSGAKGRAGVVQVVRQGTTLGILLVAQKVPANTKRNAYAVWLSNSGSDSHLVGFVNARVGSSGRLETEGALPANAAHYKHMLVTLETQSKPKTPGPVVLEGAFSL